MLDILMKQLLPPGVEMSHVVDAAKHYAGKVEACDERTRSTAETVQRIEDTLKRIETTMAGMVAQTQGVSNG